MKIKKGDTVEILAGNDKGKQGEVLTVLKKAVKPRKQGEEGGIISTEVAINSSKAGVVCPKCNKVTKIGYKVEKDEKVRVCKKCGATIK